jgi:hypothetical protein
MLALLGLLGNTASAELLKNFKANGSIDVHSYINNNTDFNKDANDKQGKTDTRVLIDATFDLNDDVNAVVSAVKCNQQYGRAAGETAVNGALDAFTFEQAYINVKGVLGLDHKFGRQYYGEAGDMIIYYGPAMWPFPSAISFGANSVAIDGWTSGYKYGNWDFGAIIANENQGNANGQQNINVYGFTAMTKIADVDLKGYVYQKMDKDTVVGDYDFTDVLGVKAKYAVPQVTGLNLGLEYAMNMGKETSADVDHKGMAYKFNADYGMDLMGKLGLVFEYYHESGDDNGADNKDEEFQSINGDYRPGIVIGGGYAGAFQGTSSGINLMKVGANWTPSAFEKLTLGGHYYDISAVEKGNLSKKHLGMETDLVATWMHSDMVSVKAYYAMFQPEKNNLANDDAQSMMGAALMVKF